MSTIRRAILAGCLILGGIGNPAVGHDLLEGDLSSGHAKVPGERTWTHASGRFRVEGSFVSLKAGQVRILKHDGQPLDIKLEALSPTDRDWVRDRNQAVVQLNTRPRILLTSQRAKAAVGAAPEIAKAFQPFAAKVKTRWDDSFFYVESDGIPDHPMMIGITSWQQQVPLPQAYTGANAWRIPLHPVVAKNPMSARNNFLRGAIALASNGIPIFNPLNNRGDDAFLFGELDDYGGHCGRADDYHYHIAPVHLQKTLGKKLPLGYALDGYPILGYEEIDGSKVGKLDSFNGHEVRGQGYHYHATKTYPYLNGGFRGEVTEREGQVDPQPRAQPARPSLPPMPGAKIVDFKWVKDGKNRLTYDINGRKGFVNYTIAKNGSLDFEFIDTAGRTVTETYQRGEQGGGGGRGPRAEGRPPRPEDGPPPDRQGGGGGGRRPSALTTALDLDNDGEISEKEIEAASKSLLKLDRDKDGLLSPEELQIEQGRGGGGGPPPRQAAADPTAGDFGPLLVASSAFAPGGKYPVDYTCDGDGVSPPIEWDKAPAGTKTFAISLWHVPADGGVKSYWVVYNIPAKTEGVPRDSKRIGTLGLNDKRRAEYDPMCSAGRGLKTYHVTVFALSKELDLPARQANREALLQAMGDSILARKTISFTYERAGDR